jgi:hypothetical protein
LERGREQVIRDPARLGQLVDGQAVDEGGDLWGF